MSAPPKPKEKPFSAFRSRYEADKRYWDALDGQKNEREKNIAKSNMELAGSELSMKIGRKMEEPGEKDSENPRPLEGVFRREKGANEKKMMRLKKKKESAQFDLEADPISDTTNKFRISGLPRPVSLHSLAAQAGDRFAWNLKYRLGESSKVLKKATFATVSRHQAGVGQRMSSDNACLRTSSSYRLAVSKSLTRRSARHNGPAEGEGAGSYEMDKIVAKKSFFLNPARNDPKVIKTKNRIYVI